MITGSGPGRVLVSFTRSDGPAVRASYGETGGLGHLTVACGETGCQSKWYIPPHEPETGGGMPATRRLRS